MAEKRMMEVYWFKYTTGDSIIPNRLYFGKFKEKTRNFFKNISPTYIATEWTSILRAKKPNPVDGNLMTLKNVLEKRVIPAQIASK